MSSHHIVRDEQEPALLLLDHQVGDKELIASLLEWSPTVITTSHLVEKFISYGFKIDVVLYPVGEIDEWKKLLIHHSPIKLVSYDDNASLLATAIYFLHSIKHTAFNVVISGFSKSTLEQYAKFSNDLNITFYDSGFKWFHCTSGHFKKWVPKNKTFRILEKVEAQMSLNDHKVIFENKEDIYQLTCPSEGLFELNAKLPLWLGEGVK